LKLESACCTFAGVPDWLWDAGSGSVPLAPAGLAVFAAAAAFGATFAAPAESKAPCGAVKQTTKPTARGSLADFPFQTLLVIMIFPPSWITTQNGKLGIHEGLFLLNWSNIRNAFSRNGFEHRKQITC
jgi:hypothetical protein